MQNKASPQDQVVKESRFSGPVALLIVSLGIIMSAGLSLVYIVIDLVIDFGRHKKLAMTLAGITIVIGCAIMSRKDWRERTTWVFSGIVLLVLSILFPWLIVDLILQVF